MRHHGRSIALASVTLAALLAAGCAPPPLTGSAAGPREAGGAPGEPEVDEGMPGAYDPSLEGGPETRGGGAEGDGYVAPESYRTEDDRPARLQSLTRSWETDWTLRSISYDEILSGGVPRDGIRPIDDPQHESIDDADAWLDDVDPVIAVLAGDEARAYPLQILTQHEIANDTLGGVPVAVTFCPLCNSAITFDRRAGGGELTFGVSGLLRNSDLIMWDRQTESLWQQLEGVGIVGRMTGLQLDIVPSLLISWADFKDAYPEGTVLAREGGRRYGRNPYVGYDSNPRPFLFRDAVDDRLPAVDRVVAVERGDDVVAYPFAALSDAGAIEDTVGDVPIAVLWKPGQASALDRADIAESRDVGSAAVFDRRLGDRTLSFEPTGEGTFRDAETGTTWNIAGQAVAGALEGERLTPVIHANHFWFAWAAFRPDTRVWGME